METIQPRPAEDLKNGHKHTTKFPMRPDPIMKASLEWMTALYRAGYNSAVAAIWNRLVLWMQEKSRW